jgi:C-terminal processing protease CtpA/Prc
MPTLHFDNPATKSNWEGKGIAPDIKVSDTDALSTAHRLALQHLVEKTTDEQALAALKQALAALAASR